MGTNPKPTLVPAPVFPLERRLGMVLVDTGAITRDQLACALELQYIRKVPLGEILLSERMIDDATWLAIMQKEFHTPPCNLDEFDLTGPLAQQGATLLNRAFCDQHRCLPLGTAGNAITVVMADPGNLETIKAIQFHTARTAAVLVATPMAIADGIRRMYGALEVQKTVQSLTDDVEHSESAPPVDEEHDADGDDIQSITALRAEAEDAPVVKLVREILIHAIRARASDIHIETHDKRTVIRFRVDGVLQ